MTAAHCENTFVENVVVGSNRLFADDGATSIPIAQKLPHPEYDDDTQENDIMLVKLASPSTAPLVNWNTNPNLPLDEQEVTLIGFGKTGEADDAPVSFDLLQVNVDVINWEMCDARINVPLFAETQLCAGVLEGGRDRYVEVHTYGTRT